MRDSRKFETSLAIWALAPASPLARESHQTGSRLWYRLGLSSVTIPIIKQMSSFIWIVLSLFTALAEFSWVKKGLLCSIKVLSMIILDGPVDGLEWFEAKNWKSMTLNYKSATRYLVLAPNRFWILNFTSPQYLLGANGSKNFFMDVPLYDRKDK